MDQQTGYSLKSSVITCVNDNPISSKQKFQNMPNVVEITMIMLGTIVEENAKKMTQRELRGFYNITNGLTNIICRLR